MNSRCCFSFCAYSEEFSFPNFFSRSCIGNLTNILAGSTSRKTSSSDNNLRIGSCRAEVRNNLAENNSPLQTKKYVRKFVFIPKLSFKTAIPSLTLQSVVPILYLKALYSRLKAQLPCLNSFLGLVEVLNCDFMR